MIQKVYIGALVLLLFQLSGCIKEDLDDCFRDYAFRVSFIYYGDGTTDIFPSKTESVQMYVFDTEGTYVDRYTYSGTSPNAFQGITLDLEPGSYDVICWSNVTGLSEITGGEGPLEDHALYSSPYLSGDPIENFDSLYFGRQRIIIPANREGEDTVYFSSAHINMEVYVEGLPSTWASRAVEDPQGWLVVRNVFVGYDFAGQVTGEVSDMYPAFVPTTQEDMMMSRFNLFRFNNQNRILIDIYNGEGRLAYTLDLSDFLAQHNINVEGVNEITVPVYIRFTGSGKVQVSVAPWGSEIVNPIV